MKIYTAQYNYSGDDRLDITVKGNTSPGSVLAPTWEMVRGLQQGKLNQWDYTIKYFSLLMSRIYASGYVYRVQLEEIVTNRQQLTLVCFCPSGQFCHRILAAHMLENMGYGKYIGEWQI